MVRFAVRVELLLVIVPLTVSSVHVALASFPTLRSSDLVPLVRLKVTVVFGHGLVHGVVVVLQRTLAEAEPAARKTISAAARIVGARPSSLTYLICFSRCR